ncbi:MAG: hypothetical protein K0Q50_2303 [Vampirovibrio sp.]|jgi:prepilin-type N-terminal cleavage/methylation domain-containing protein|nr:hypothetical protein [Vampirovibrio sp.]
MIKISHSGFTLAELLIALAVLGVIATFTIPKILHSSQNEQYKAVTKEASAAIAAAYQTYKLNNPISATTKLSDLTPYLNYTKIDTSGSSTIDDSQGLGTITCNSNNNCLRLHNGAVLLYYDTMAFGGTSSTNAIWFNLDPDGKVTDGVNGKSVQIWLYLNGRMTTVGTIEPNSCWNAGCNAAPLPSLDPDWFSWQ